MKLLIFSPDSWSVFFPETQFVFGGIETETGHYAHQLASQHGVRVTVVTRDQGTASRFAGRVKLMAHPQLKGDGYWKKRNSLSGRIRFRLGGLKESGNDAAAFYAEQNPDIVFVQGPSKDALILLDYCRKNRKKFVFRIASDLDLGGETADAAAIERWTKMKADDVKQLITGADLVLAQSPFQQEVLRRHFQKASTVLLNPLDLSSELQVSEKKYDLLWVGKNSEVKRPELFLQVCNELPQYRSCFICNRIQDNGWNELLQAVPANVKHIAFVPADQIEEYFAASRVFVNTSGSEGFANTFLQAAKYGLPVVSLNADPNGMLSHHGAGFVCDGKTETAKEKISLLLSDPALYAKASAAGKAYVKAHHDARTIAADLFRLLSDLNG